MKERFIGAFLLAILTSSGQGQAPPPQPDPGSGIGPVQAELLANLDVRKVVVGKTIFARVTQDWYGQECLLGKGAVLEATVEQAIPRQGKDESKLALSFKQAQCDGREMQPMDLVLTVIAQPPMDWSRIPNAQFNMTMEMPNPHPISPSYGVGMSAPSQTQPSPTTGISNSSNDYAFTRMALTQLQLSAIEHRFPARKNIRPGDVIDLKGLRLDVGTGPNRSSVISSKNRDLFLSEFTQLLLMQPSRAFRPPGPIAIAASQPKSPSTPVRASTSPAPAAPPPNEINVCAPPGCVVDLPVTAQELQGHSTGSIATRALGYTPRTRRVQARFADEESIAWLGARQLLFAFDPHKPVLRKRTDPRGTARMIRAVLLDTTTRKLLRAVDWEIADDRAYLWQLDGERVLVHVGNELRIYRAGLEMERTIPLAGPLLFIRSAPGGGLLAIATLRERHSSDLHAKLRSELGSEPEEDVDVAILNQDFKTVAQLTTLSNLIPPTLLDEGQVRLQYERGQSYNLAMNTWQNQRKPLARFNSFCTPEVTSTAPDLLFLLACDAAEGKMQFSVLRPNGKVLLRGVSTPQELGHEALGNRRGRNFAVKIVHAERPIFRGTNFTNSELDSAEVRVYRAGDGKRVLAVRVNDPIASHGGYALSPDGSELAVLSASEIQFFAVPSE